MGEVPQHVPHRPPSAARRPGPAGFAEAGKEGIKALRLPIEQSEGIEPGQLTVVSHPRLPAAGDSTRWPPSSLTDNT
jgi:hypothetical protein